jgi:hypothetical protein
MQWVTMNGRIGTGAWGGLNSYWVSPQIVRATAPAAAASPPRCCCLERAKRARARSPDVSPALAHYKYCIAPQGGRPWAIIYSSVASV